MDVLHEEGKHGNIEALVLDIARTERDPDPHFIPCDLLQLLLVDNLITTIYPLEMQEWLERHSIKIMEARHTLNVVVPVRGTESLWVPSLWDHFPSLWPRICEGSTYVRQLGGLNGNMQWHQRIYTMPWRMIFMRKMKRLAEHKNSNHRYPRRPFQHYHHKRA